MFLLKFDKRKRWVRCEDFYVLSWASGDNLVLYRENAATAREYRVRDWSTFKVREVKGG